MAVIDLGQTDIVHCCHNTGGHIDLEQTDIIHCCCNIGGHIDLGQTDIVHCCHNTGGHIDLGQTEKQTTDYVKGLAPKMCTRFVLPH